MKIINISKSLNAVVVTPARDIKDQRFNKETLDRVKRFHLSMEEYKATPLVSLNRLANRLHVNNIYVKDESYRFGLNAFKVVGGIYGLASTILKHLKVDTTNIDMNMLHEPSVAKKIKKLTIISATDGNHGRGLAWAGQKLGCKVLIYMPKATTKERANLISDLGAEVTITEFNYDDTLRVVIEQAEKNQTYLHVQDTAWEGYAEIPNWISQGYMTVADEAITQLHFSGYKQPTHVFLQAGAGSFALGIIGHLVTTFGDQCPKIIIMEPKNANCFYESIVAQGSKPIRVHGDLETVMAGLSVGEVSTEAWALISNYANAYIMCDDSLSAKGTRLLASPLGDDKKVISGESGSIGIGVLDYLMTHDACGILRTELDINETSNVLIFSTEGDTDSSLYNQIVYNGHIQSI